MRRCKGHHHFRRIPAAAAVLSVSLFLAGCGVSAGAQGPAGTAETGPHATHADPKPTPGPSGNSAGGATGTAPASPTAEPTAPQWKKYTDPASTLSFELPEDWTTQLVPGPTGKAVRVDVRSTSGDVVASLQTQVSGLGGACGKNLRRPYTVLASIPLELPSNNRGAAAVDPRYVYRVIQGGTHFYASYGITDQAAGADGKACLVYNTVQSDRLGIYMFGDVLQFTSALDGSPGLRAFATIADAQAYMLTGEYLNVQRMVTSLKILG